MSGGASGKPSDGSKDAFHSKFSELVRELTEDGIKNPEISDGIQHLKDVRKHKIPRREFTIIMIFFYFYR